MKKIKYLLQLFSPPKEWRLVVFFIVGLFIGIVIIILRVSNATAYLSDDPKACINCHVMFPQYETWLHSSHREKAVCNDCHVPHDSMLNKYLFKAKDGMRHATIYTLRKEPQVIRMHEDGQRVVQNNCIHCHEKLIDGTNLIHGDYKQFLNGDAKLCWQCHREIPHGRVRSLATTPYYQVPELEDVSPESIKPMRNYIEKMIFLPKEGSYE